jgi:RNA polymerase sigma-70 factor (ECF subfamily)
MEARSDAAVDAQLVALRPALLTLASILSGNPGDADDFVQTALMKALEWRERLRPDTNLKAWLIRVIRNLAIDAARQSKKDAGVTDPDLLPAPPPESEPVWALLSREHIVRALRGCAPPLQQAFELHYFGGVPLAEIARLQRTNIGTVGVRLFRARARLRAALTVMLPAASFLDPGALARRGGPPQAGVEGAELRRRGAP